MLEKEAVKEFQEIWLAEYGRHIDDVVAEKIATKLLNMTRAIYKPVPRTDEKLLDKYEEKK